MPGEKRFLERATVSRILFTPAVIDRGGPSFLSTGPLDGSRPLRRSGVRLIPGFIHRPEPAGGAGCPFTLFCLAPHRVCPAPVVTRGAVSSYLAFSPLPAEAGGLFSATLSVTVPLQPGAPAFDGDAAVWCPDFPLSSEKDSDRLRPVPRAETLAAGGRLGEERFQAGARGRR